MEELLWIGAMAIVIVGICFLLDRTLGRRMPKINWGRTEGRVRQPKRQTLFGLLAALLGLICVVYYRNSHPLIFCSGVVLLIAGGLLCWFYLWCGVFYDENGFQVRRFGGKGLACPYEQILFQKVWTSRDRALVELHLAGGAVMISMDMDGAREFLDYASRMWQTQKRLKPEDCPFHRPEALSWFPSKEVR